MKLKLNFQNKSLRENCGAKRYKLRNDTIGTHRDKIIEKDKREFEKHGR